MSVGNQEHVSIGDVGFYVRTLPGIPTMAFTKSQQSYAFFALLFGGVFFVCVIVTQLESSPFPDGETTTGTVTGVETRGDQLPHTYTPPMGDVTQLVGRFPWMQNVMIFASLPLLIFLTPKHIFDKTKKQER